MARRRSLALANAPSVKTTMSAPVSSMTRRDSSGRPMTGMPVAVSTTSAPCEHSAPITLYPSHVSRRRTAATSSMCRTSPTRITASWRCPRSRLRWMKRRSRSRPSTSSGDPGQEEQHEEAAREREAGEVAADAHQTGAQQRRLDEAFVLLRGGSEDVLRVGADGDQHGHPSAQERQDGDADDLRDVAAGLEDGELLTSHDGQQRGEGEQEQVTGSGDVRDHSSRVRRAGAEPPAHSTVELGHSRSPPNELGSARDADPPIDISAESAPKVGWGEAGVQVLEMGSCGQGQRAAPRRSDAGALDDAFPPKYRRGTEFPPRRRVPHAPRIHPGNNEERVHPSGPPRHIWAHPTRPPGAGGPPRSRTVRIFPTRTRPPSLPVDSLSWDPPSEAVGRGRETPDLSTCAPPPAQVAGPPLIIGRCCLTVTRG